MGTSTLAILGMYCNDGECLVWPAHLPCFKMPWRDVFLLSNIQSHGSILK